MAFVIGSSRFNNYGVIRVNRLGHIHVQFSLFPRSTIKISGILLSPANEVWGQVMFLHLWWRGDDFPACITGHMTGDLPPGVREGGVGQTPPPRYMRYHRIQSTSRWYGCHPTGMNSCSQCL